MLKSPSGWLSTFPETRAQFRRSRRNAGAVGRRRPSGVAAWAPARRELRFALARGSGTPEQRSGAQNAQEARPQDRRSTAWTGKAVWQRGSEHAGVNAMALRGGGSFRKIRDERLRGLAVPEIETTVAQSRLRTRFQRIQDRGFSLEWCRDTAMRHVDQPPLRIAAERAFLRASLAKPQRTIPSGNLGERP